MVVASLHRGLLCLFVVAAVKANKIPCAWTQPRAGTVRNAFYIDGGQYFVNDWENGAWANQYGSDLDKPPAGQIQRFNYSLSFDSGNSFNLSNLLFSMPLTVGGDYSAPPYIDGALFADDFEFYLYG